MTPCPNCQKPVQILDKHLGTLFTCPHCNAVFFVDWNGQPELASHELEPETETPSSEEGFSSGFESSSDFQAGSDFQSENDFQVGGFQGDFASSGESFATPSSHSQMSYEGQIPESVPEEMSPQEEPYLDPAEEIPQGSEFISPESYQSSEGASEYAAVDSMEAGNQGAYGDLVEEANAGHSGESFAQQPEEAPYDFSSTLDSVPEANSHMNADTSDFSDVADFANSDTSAGPLSYTITLEGLESSHLVKELREAMTDSKFGWDVNALLEGIHRGRLELRDLSPTKAFVLLSRIKYLPIKISWRQNVL